MTEHPYHRQNLAAAIAQQARQQLEEQGVDQLSLRQIARFLAVTPAAVYRHYPDKAALLAQLRTEIIEELTAALRAGVLDSADAPTMLRRMVTNLLTYAAEHPRAVTFILSASLVAPQSLRTVVTLLLAQRATALSAEQATMTVWTFLLGVLLRLPDPAVDVEWVTAQLQKLLVA